MTQAGLTCPHGTGSETETGFEDLSADEPEVAQSPLQQATGEFRSYTEHKAPQPLFLRFRGRPFRSLSARFREDPCIVATCHLSRETDMLPALRADLSVASDVPMSASLALDSTSGLECFQEVTRWELL